MRSVRSAAPSTPRCSAPSCCSTRAAAASACRLWSCSSASCRRSASKVSPCRSASPSSSAVSSFRSATRSSTRACTSAARMLAIRAFISCCCNSVFARSAARRRCARPAARSACAFRSAWRPASAVTRAQLRHREILEVAQRPERLRRPPALEGCNVTAAGTRSPVHLLLQAQARPFVEIGACAELRTVRAQILLRRTAQLTLERHVANSRPAVAGVASRIHFGGYPSAASCACRASSPHDGGRSSATPATAGSQHSPPPTLRRGASSCNGLLWRGPTRRGCEEGSPAEERCQQVGSGSTVGQLRMCAGSSSSRAPDQLLHHCLSAQASADDRDRDRLLPPLLPQQFVRAIRPLRDRQHLPVPRRQGRRDAEEAEGRRDRVVQGAASEAGRAARRRTQRKLERVLGDQGARPRLRADPVAVSASTSSSTRTGVRATIAQRRASPASLPPSSSSSSRPAAAPPALPCLPPLAASPRAPPSPRAPAARSAAVPPRPAVSLLLLPSPPPPPGQAAAPGAQEHQGTRELAQVARNFTNDSLKSAVVVLGFAPRAIAAAAVSLAAQYVQQGESALPLRTPTRSCVVHRLQGRARGRVDQSRSSRCTVAAFRQRSPTPPSATASLRLVGRRTHSGGRLAIMQFFTAPLPSLQVHQPSPTAAPAPLPPEVPPPPAASSGPRWRMRRESSLPRSQIREATRRRELPAWRAVGGGARQRLACNGLGSTAPYLTLRRARLRAACRREKRPRTFGDKERAKCDF